MARNGSKLFEMAARARNGDADGSKWPLEHAPEPQNTRKVPIESAPEPQNARRVPLESAPNRRMLDGCCSSHPRGAENSTGAARASPGAAACSKSAARAPSREVRSFLAFEMAARRVLPLFVFYRHQLLLSSTLLRACYARVHTSIYIYIYTRFAYGVLRRL